jgi:hypothetical protein
MERFNLVRRQIQELIFKISNNDNIPYTLVRTIERDVNSSSINHDIDELKEIKTKLEFLVSNSLVKNNSLY